MDCCTSISVCQSPTVRPPVTQVYVVLGAQWGDEGKGKLVDILTEKMQLVARCQGGNNAGHTVIVGEKAYDFHLLPCGIIWDGCEGLIGNGVVIHLPGFFEELEKNIAKGLTGWETRLKISDRAHIVFDFHQTVDGMQESNREGLPNTTKLGTTKRGIGPTYASKMNRTGVRLADLIDNFADFTNKFCILADNYVASFPELKVDKPAEIERYRLLAERVRPLVVESVSYLHNRLAEGKKVLVEGANAAMLDIDFGTYPYVTSSNCSIGGVCTGLGIPAKMIGEVYGVVKAYTTRVGDGPFPTELANELGAWMQKEGHEFGVTTGRPRRCGWLDIPLLRFTNQVNGYTALCLTKTDILDKLDEIKIGVNYIKNGKVVDHYPSGIFQFDGLEVEYITMPGWKTSIADIRDFDKLPDNCKNYVLKIEELLGLPFKWVGVGPSRDAMILRPDA
jgi:adenylosuccinate synthase